MVTPADIRRDEFAARVAGGASLSEAAAAVGITANTATRWARHPEVLAALERYRAELRAATSDRLTRLTGTALDRAEEILADPNTPPNVMVRVLAIALAETRAWVETDEFERRLAALEESRTPAPPHPRLERIQ